GRPGPVRQRRRRAQLRVPAREGARCRSRGCGQAADPQGKPEAAADPDPHGEGGEAVTIDTNAHLGHWPFRRHGFEETSRFVTKLRALKVEEAWVASFDGVLHKDVASANARLAAECGDHGGGLLVPFGTVNPRLPDWPEDLRRCHELHRMPGVRLYPNYHGYPLDDPEFSRLLKLPTAPKFLLHLV